MTVPFFRLRWGGRDSGSPARGHDSRGDSVRSTTPGPQSKVRLCQYPVDSLVSIE